MDAMQELKVEGVERRSLLDGGCAVDPEVRKHRGLRIRERRGGTEAELCQSRKRGGKSKGGERRKRT